MVLIEGWGWCLGLMSLYQFASLYAIYGFDWGKGMMFRIKSGYEKIPALLGV